MPAREVLTNSTQGRATVLGRDDTGRLTHVVAADIVAWRTDGLFFQQQPRQPHMLSALKECQQGRP